MQLPNHADAVIPLAFTFVWRLRDLFCDALLGLHRLSFYILKPNTFYFMKKYLFLFSLLMSCASLFAQSSIRVQATSLLEDTPVSTKWLYLTANNSSEVLDSTQTDVKGYAVFENVAVGKAYSIYALDDEIYQAAILTDLRPKEGVLNVTLNLPNQATASIGEILISSTSLVRMNTENATVSGQMKKEELQRLPLEGRDVTRSLFRLPNVTVSVLGYAEGPNISINGLNGIFTNYLIDGMDNNERFLGNAKFNTPVGFVENITVLTNNYSAEWGNTSNGIVNVLSRSGSNDWTGEVFYLTRPGAGVDAPSSFATLDLYGNPVKDGFQRQQTGVSLGGPIKKDKTFFYVNVEQTYDYKDNLLNVAQLGVNEIVRGVNRFTYASAKLDHIWSPNWRTSVRAQVGRFYNQRQGGGLEGGILFPSASSAQDNETYLLALRNQYKIGSKINGELNYQRSFFRWNYREPVNATSPSVTIQNPAGTAIAIVGQSGAIFDDFEYTDQFQSKWLYRSGKHLFKAGVEYIRSDFQLLGGGNPFGTYTIRLTEQQLTDVRNLGRGSALDVADLPTDVNIRNYDVELRPTTFGAVQQVTSAYLEDQWSVNSRLNISLGVRWDYDNLSKAGGTKGDFNNIGPRGSFNYKLDNKSVIRGGYGIYYDKIKYSVYSDNLQFSSNSEDFKKQLVELQRAGVLDANADLDRITFPGNIRATAPPASVAFPNGPSAAELQPRRETQFTNNLRIMNPNGFQNPYSHQFSLGYQRKLSDEHLFIFDAVHTRTENLYIIRNLNAALPWPSDDAANFKVRSRANADSSRVVPIYQDAAGFYAIAEGNDTLRGIARNVFVSETAGIARYTALNFMLQKSVGDNKIGYRLLYTLSWTKSNTSSINTRAQDSNDFDAEYAWDENDRRHVISAVLLYEPLKGLLISPTALIQSGQPVTRVADATVFGTTDLNGDGESFGLPADRWPGEPKSGDRLPWATTFDLSARYQFDLKGSSAIEVSADIFNIFNAQNWSGYNTTRSVSNLSQVGPKSSNTYRLFSASPPRQFQFGARYIF